MSVANLHGPKVAVQLQHGETQAKKKESFVFRKFKSFCKFVKVASNGATKLLRKIAENFGFKSLSERKVETAEVAKVAEQPRIKKTLDSYTLEELDQAIADRDDALDSYYEANRVAGLRMRAIATRLKRKQRTAAIHEALFKHNARRFKYEKMAPAQKKEVLNKVKYHAFMKHHALKLVDEYKNHMKFQAFVKVVSQHKIDEINKASDVLLKAADIKEQKQQKKKNDI